MKSIFLLALCAITLLPSCTKDNQASADLQVSGFGPVVFAGGDAISVYGSGFDPMPENNIISFNGVNGEVATATPNRLQVIVPPQTTSGKLTLTVHGRTVNAPRSYSIVNVLQGTYDDNFTLTSDRQYLLRGDVAFNSKLIIQPGTIIYGEKISRASLTATDIDFEGTAEHPIVFTSDQPEGQRNPGDWKGVNILAQRGDGQNSIANGILQYVRVEYAGYFEVPYNTPFYFYGPFWGAALHITPTAGSTYKYIQVSYSATDGLSLGSSRTDAIVNGGETYFHHLIALGCMGADFRLMASGIRAQFGLGLKDPYFAGTDKSDGLVSYLSQGNTANLVSNFTLVGYNPDARNISDAGAVVNQDGGAGVKMGVAYYPGGGTTTSYGGISFCNSVLAGSSSAAVAFNGSFEWSLYEVPDPNEVQVRNCFVTGTSPMLLPVRAGVLGRTNAATATLPYMDITADPNFALFASLNDTARQLSFSQNKDDLGIKDLVDYQRLNHPGLLPASGSVLLNGARFPAGTPIFNPFLDKNTTWVGAFGTEDWTASWSNFSPQTTLYRNTGSL